MKKYALSLMTGLSVFTAFAQSTTDKISNQDVALVTTPTAIETTKVKPTIPEGKYAKIKIIESYERVLEKGYITEAMLTKVADYRFFDGDLVTAAKWYSQLFEFCPDELEAVYFYRYSKSLESVNQMEKAKEMMAIYQIRKI
ncbi:MAG: hypothetical protein V4535_02350 [Bacteroidota bacterium]